MNFDLPTMHPFFIAHVIADFLLQPKALVEWKNKKLNGTILHAVIHGVILAILLWPKNPALLLLALGLAVLHGFIDQWKVQSQKYKRNFELLFAADQIIHLAVLFAAAKIFMADTSFWQTNGGLIAGYLAFYFSFGIALFNLSKLKDFPLKNAKHALVRALTIFAVFTIFLLAARFAF